MDAKTSMFNKPKTILWGNGKKNIDHIPRIIWIYWESEKEQPLVEICIKKIQFTLHNYEVNILNNKSLKDFLPDIPDKKKNLPIANYSDYIRLDLLRQYGGVWIDASMLLTENLDWIFTLENDYHPDIIGFYSDFFSNDLEYPILENWFIAASKGNHFIEDWFQEYQKCYLSEKPHEFYNDIITNTTYIQKIDYKLATYILPYISAIKVMRENSSYKILMISANDTAHYYNFSLQLPPHRLAELFLLEKTSREVPKLIKFEKKGRNLIEEYITRGQYSNKSLLFKITKHKINYSKKLLRLINYAIYILKNMEKKYLS